MMRPIRWAILALLTSLLAACGSGGGGGGGAAPADSGSRHKVDPPPVVPENGMARLTVDQISEIHKQLLAEFQKSALPGSEWIHVAGWKMDQLLTSVGQVSEEDLQSPHGEKMFFYFYQLMHEGDGSVRLSINPVQTQKLLEVENLNLGGY